MPGSQHFALLLSGSSLLICLCNAVMAQQPGASARTASAKQIQSSNISSKDRIAELARKPVDTNKKVTIIPGPNGFSTDYKSILKVSPYGSNRGNKPAEAFPATSCNHIETARRESGVKNSAVLDLNDSMCHMFANNSGFGAWRMAIDLNARNIAMPSKMVNRVELVGLLLHEDPVVYVMDQVPTPALARVAQTRMLDEFETLALNAVRNGEDVVWTNQAPNRLFGAIRAEKSCTECHLRAKENELLGAFTYSLDCKVDELGRNQPKRP